MKKICAFLILLTLHLQSSAQGGTWTWVNGTNVLGDLGNIGTLGVTNPANYPEGRYQGCSWIDLNGNFWMFGGVDNSGTERNDLWEYSPTANTWTWVNGPITGAGAGVYGTLGVPSPTNIPGARGWGLVYWTDLQGRLWLRGGDGYDQTGSYGSLDDMWMYDITTNQWTWMAGSASAGAPAVYGTLGVAAAGNTPGGRVETNSSWVRSDGTLWTFGGEPTFGTNYSDMWMFDISTNLWTWMSGPQGVGNAGNYGTLNLEVASNLPPPRGTYTSWEDENDNFYIFGGGEWFGAPDSSYNDVWRYNTSNGFWTWINGDNAENLPGLYTQTCNSAGGVRPSTRFECRTPQNTICTNTFWTYGGYDDNSDAIGDLWSFSVQTGQWTWVSGTNTPNTLGNYGTMGVPLASNLPPAKGSPCLWADRAGTLWMWGGCSASWGSKFDDMWHFVPDTSCVHAALTISPTVQNSDSIICPGDTSRLYLNGAHVISVTPSSTATILSDSLHVNFYPSVNTTYAVLESGLCRGLDTLYYTITLSNLVPVAQSMGICPGDSFLFYGSYISAVGVYHHTITNPSGCDTAVTMTVTTATPVTTNLSQGICAGHPIQFHGTTITTTGVYTDTMTAVTGCDSVIILTVTTGTPVITNLSQGLCPTGTITFGGQLITFPGTYYDTLTAVSGCDSIIALDVFSQFFLDTAITQNICPGGSYFFDGQVLTTPGFYQATYTTATGCDSSVDLTLAILTPLDTSVSATLCAGDTFLFNGLQITAPGIYYDTLYAFGGGCDSVNYTIAVSVFQPVVTALSQSICQGGSLNFNGRTITSGGVYYDTLQTVIGCDSTIILTVSASQAGATTVSQAMCIGDTILFNGTVVTSLGLYTDTLVNVAGCDSIVNLLVTQDTTASCANGAFVMPDAFSPNGDAKNELFYPVLLNPATSHLVKYDIYNRWGQLIYSNAASGWDGTYSGEPQPAGVYTYFITISLPNSTGPGMREISKGGSFTLIR